MRPPKPRVTVGEAEKWAREHFGIVAHARVLPGEVDRNFLLRSPAGRRWVLKAAPVDSLADEIECQLAVLDYLATTDLRDRVPTLVADRQGRLVRRVRTAAGEETLVRAVTYLPGEPLATVGRPTVELGRQIGHLLGRLDRLLEAFDHAGAHRDHFWDLATVLDLEPWITALASDLQPLVRAGLDRFAARVRPRLSELPTSVIHNDANDYNLLVEPTPAGWHLTGIIDFGDMIHTATVAELAIASAYVMLDASEPDSVAREVAAGYESERPLTDLERELLPELRIARLCHSLLMSAQARAVDPADPYLRISERPVAELLTRLVPES